MARVDSNIMNECKKGLKVLYNPAKPPTPSIDWIGDEDLQRIFLYLPTMLDRLIIENVCRRWKRVSLQHCWCSRDCRVLSLSQACVTMRDVHKVIDRCGQHIQLIDLSAHGEHLDCCDLMDEIDRYCTNVRALDLSSLKGLQPSHLGKLRRLRKLERLVIGEANGNCDQMLEWLVRRNVGLKALELRTTPISGKLFRKIPPKRIETLALRGVSTDFENLCAAIHKYENLREYIIEYCEDVNDSILEKLTCELRNLRALQFSGYFPQLIKDLRCITALSNLRILNVSNNLHVNDDFLMSVVEGCRLLKIVDVSDCRKVSEEGLKQITSLPKLEHLYINNLGHIKKFDFLSMPKLKTFECSNCYNLQEENIIALLNTSLNIELLDIYNCRLISKNLFNIVKNFINGKVLKIRIHTVDIKIEDLFNLPSIRLFSSPGQISIHFLNDDCLLHIFKFVPLVDKIILKKVCKRWYGLTKRLWPKFMRLDMMEAREKIPEYQAEIILSTLSATFTHIDFSVFQTPLSLKLFSKIGTICINLESIDVSSRMLFFTEMFALGNYRSIKKLTLGPTRKYENILKLAFRKLEQLEYLKIISNNEVTGFLFQGILFKYLDTIIIVKCNLILDNEFAENIQSLKNLKNLTLSQSRCVLPRVPHGEEAPPITIFSETLKTLKLFENLPEIALGQLSKLEVLDLSNNSKVTDEYLEGIGSHCKSLLKLDLSNCTDVTNNGLLYVTKLTKLQYLSINNLDKVTDQYLYKMPNLRVLQSRNCQQFFNAGLIDLLDKAPYLEILDVTNCKYINEVLVFHAIKMTASRKSMIALDMHVGGTSINTSAIKGNSPYVRLHDLLNVTPVPDSVSDEHFFQSFEEMLHF